MLRSLCFYLFFYFKAWSIYYFVLRFIWWNVEYSWCRMDTLIKKHWIRALGTCKRKCSVVKSMWSLDQINLVLNMDLPVTSLTILDTLLKLSKSPSLCWEYIELHTTEIPTKQTNTSGYTEHRFILLIICKGFQAFPSRHCVWFQSRKRQPRQRDKGKTR